VANVIKVNKAAIRLQAWIRMVNVRKKIYAYRQSIRAEKKEEPNMKLMKDFVQILKAKKMTPEDLLRAIDKSLSGTITVELFIEELL